MYYSVAGPHTVGHDLLPAETTYSEVHATLVPHHAPVTHYYAGADLSAPHEVKEYLPSIPMPMPAMTMHTMPMPAMPVPVVEAVGHKPHRHKHRHHKKSRGQVEDSIPVEPESNTAEPTG